MPVSWFVRGNGKIYGPLDATRLKQLASEGKIDQSTDVAQNEAGPWVPAGKVKGLFASASAPRADTLPSTPTSESSSQTEPRSSTSIGPPPQDQPLMVRLRTTASNYLPHSQLGKLILTACTSSVLSLTIGYFLGREHLRYQIRSTFEDAGKQFVKDLRQGFQNAFTPPETEKPAAKPEPVKKLSLGQSFESPSCSIVATAARIDRPLVKGGMSRESVPSDKDCLVIDLRVQNKDARKQLAVSYGNQFQGNVFSIRDDADNEVATKFFSDPGSQYSLVDAHPSYKKIDPEQTVSHIIAFDKPLPKTQSLSFLIDLKLIGQEGVVQYQIPISSVANFNSP